MQVHVCACWYCTEQREGEGVYLACHVLCIFGCQHITSRFSSSSHGRSFAHHAVPHVLCCFSLLFGCSDCPNLQ